MDCVREPNRSQFPRPKQPRQGHCIASIGLDPVSRLLGNQRRRYHRALVTQRYNLPIEPITRWSSFVADPYLLILACQFLDQPLNSRRCASISPRYHVSPSRPASAMATACFFFAVSIPTKTSLYFPMVRPSCVEALLGPPEQPSCSLWHVGAGRLASVDHRHDV
jgi:hypothetical protein